MKHFILPPGLASFLENDQVVHPNRKPYCHLRARLPTTHGCSPLAAEDASFNPFLIRARLPTSQRGGWLAHLGEVVDCLGNDLWCQTNDRHQDIAKHLHGSPSSQCHDHPCRTLYAIDSSPCSTLYLPDKGNLLVLWHRLNTLVHNPRAV